MEHWHFVVLGIVAIALSKRYTSTHVRTKGITSLSTSNDNDMMRTSTSAAGRLAATHETTTYYVSITGLRLKSIFHEPRFWYYAIPSMIQARSSPGNIRAESYVNNGIKHTLSVWTDKASMLQYLRQGAHLQAMKITSSISSYTKVYGYETDRIPTDWHEMIEIWETHGRVVGVRPAKKKTEL